MKNIRKIKKLAINNLNRIYTSSKEIANAWGKETIPLKTLSEILKKSVLSEKIPIPAVNKHNIAYNKCLATLYDTLAKMADKMDSNSVPLTELKKGIKIITKEYKKMK